MRDVDVENVAWRLDAMVRRGRREAVEYVLLTAFCTPVFVIAGSLVIGRVQMRILPGGFSKYGEYRLPLDPGAYVWHEIR